MLPSLSVAGEDYFRSSLLIHQIAASDHHDHHHHHQMEVESTTTLFLPESLRLPAPSVSPFFSQRVDFAHSVAHYLVSPSFQHNFRNCAVVVSPLVFEGSHLPSISLADFSERCIRYVDSWAGDLECYTGMQCALIALVYLSRVPVVSSVRNIHRLLLAALLCAVKFSEDFKITNRFWAKVGGIGLGEMNTLEIHFLGLIQWNLMISESDLAKERSRFLL